MSPEHKRFMQLMDKLQEIEVEYRDTLAELSEIVHERVPTFKECECCKAEFNPNSSIQKYCSNYCRNRAQQIKRQLKGMQNELENESGLTAADAGLTFNGKG